MSAKQPRSRKWFGTIWIDRDLEKVRNCKTVYTLISDLDKTEEGQEHWHCLLLFKNNNYHPNTETAHWEIPSSVFSAQKYCLDKGPLYYQTGTFTFANQNKDDWKEFVELCKTSNPKEMIESPYSKIYARYRSFAGEVHNIFANLSIMDGDLCNLWLYGKAGTGKTKWAWDHYPDLFVKSINKWWDGYRDQETVLLDDWDPKHEVLVSHLKIWADRYPFRAETKGSSQMARPKRIIVTSNYSIEECFPNPQDVMAIKRRFKCHFFFNFGEEPTLIE